MILVDKIIEERKKLDLTQEELAEKLYVSSQAVSKLVLLAIKMKIMKRNIENDFLF